MGGKESMLIADVKAPSSKMTFENLVVNIYIIYVLYRYAIRLSDTRYVWSMGMYYVLVTKCTYE